MKEIILIRHGKPQSATNFRVTPAGFARWVRNYDKSEVDDASRPEQRRDLTDYFVISSTLPRAIHSASIYTGTLPSKTHCELNEMDIPYYNLPFQLKAWSWVYLNRLFWLMGAQSRCESYQEAKTRIDRGADIVERYANEHTKVAVFAHGMTNRYLSSVLVKKGWRCEQKEFRYWGITKFISY